MYKLIFLFFFYQNYQKNTHLELLDLLFAVYGWPILQVCMTSSNRYHVCMAEQLLFPLMKVFALNFTAGYIKGTSNSAASHKDLPVWSFTIISRWDKL